LSSDEKGVKRLISKCNLSSLSRTTLHGPLMQAVRHAGRDRPTMQLKLALDQEDARDCLDAPSTVPPHHVVRQSQTHLLDWVCALVTHASELVFVRARRVPTQPRGCRCLRRRLDKVLFASKSFPEIQDVFTQRTRFQSWRVVSALGCVFPGFMESEWKEKGIWSLWAYRVNRQGEPLI